MRTALALTFLLVAAPLCAATTNNDDSCDIALQPAATLLLPYFEVDLKATRAATTLFTIQNVSPSPVIANVTLWTDWGYPALSFPIHLTGYDVQGVNLYDVLGAGALPPTECHAGNIAPAILPDLQATFTTGGAGACSGPVGFFHLRAIGYATIDVVSSCAAKSVDFSTLLYDNVLTGDYQQLATFEDHVYASGGPLVHIRAIPEGGAAGTVMATRLTHTFYERYMPDPLARNADRRQPLPSVFAARYIAGGAGAFNTKWKIWREAIAAGSCQTARSNSNMAVTDLVRFDEHENATSQSLASTSGLAVTSTLLADSAQFPPLSASGDVGGWLYLNSGGQSWMTVAMFAAPTYATEATATALGNGCSAAVKSGAQIGPTP
jgi:hypothetical protein